MSTPDLQTVLATLAQFSQPQAFASQPLPFNALPSLSFENAVPRSQLPTDSCQPTKTVIDPASITTWQEGLRCVTKIAAQNKSFEESIRKMMHDQRTHEMKWYAERQKLKHTQSNRSKSTAEAISILQALSSSVAGSSSTCVGGATGEAELAALDLKIYRAQQAMEAAMTLELKGLGVPFFGTQPSLIRQDEQTEDPAMPSGRPRYSKPITQAELLHLQRQMIQHLETLYRD